MENPEVLGKEGKRVVLLGNEAIARGAMESGVGVVACYPGTPSSEVPMTLSDVAQETKSLYFEWSTNEKVAYEVCAGAAWSGVRALTAMKHFGLNVAADSFFPVIFTGVKGGFVVVVADDPLGHSSAQSEQDTRFYYRMGKVPCLEPSDTQESKDLTKLAFEISERYEIPVVLRITTMVSHSAGTVKLGKIRKPKTTGKFVKDLKRYYNIRPNLQVLHAKLIEKLDKIEKEYGMRLNRIEGRGSLGIITSGVSYQYVKELGRLSNVKIAKLNLTHPISKAFVSKFLKGLKTVIVVEELEPVVENFVREVAKDVNSGLKIHGKDIMSRVGEYTPDSVLQAVAPILKLRKPDFRRHDQDLKKIKIPVRKPVFCPGCPHRSTFYAVRKVMGDNVVWAGDVGCYVLGIFEPFEMQDFMISMGASLGLTHGIKKVSKQKAVVFIGDSTFFHNGMPGLVNMARHGTKPLVMIMDNGITAMTGHQPHPGTEIDGMGIRRKPILIEDVARSFGIKNVRVVNAFDQKSLQSAIRELSKKDELCVIVSRGLCRLVMKRNVRAQGGTLTKFKVVNNQSINCKELVKKFACPAMVMKGGKVFIREDVCLGCGVCMQLAGKGDISPIVKGKKEKE
ncbi:MAG: indolepyruvate ferredoxin oxidoreductase subunit alpha [Candidatus Aenigmarchaeota archaeon]|nr:indolepyruvate ferredoxin oxidoreductase subunit alpha [Candidatus Aenigmarchaeota archaeon]NIP40372.1 indolepyruvate ferredoxin oxidoreductase subunit alpha [Candidatus Aenigmarchaeota archaeon]NIQ18298.1 indolepyruvate ferredoxin oxidoreductase subunit alpha [Candidatus Aenigmarchaeota archaeon]NIS73250.1 indolepyruvate ferredoxin oxidoreductase subunit alpha [Candidatus Aenigmarchaeota archaeon]